MEFGPIIRALKRNKIRFLLIVVQIAITLAVVTNAVTMIRSESEKMSKRSGFDDDNIFWVRTRPFSPAFKDLSYRISAVNTCARSVESRASSPSRTPTSCRGRAVAARARCSLAAATEAST
jgi:hypothetical protein